MRQMLRGENPGNNGVASQKIARPAAYTVDLNVFDIHDRISSGSQDK
jgi:hypothetical protein